MLTAKYWTKQGCRGEVLRTPSQQSVCFYFTNCCCFLKSPAGTALRALNRSLFDNCCFLASVPFCETCKVVAAPPGGISVGSPEVPWCLKLGQGPTGPPQELLQWTGKQRTKIQIPPVQQRSSADQGLPENVIPQLGCRDLSVNICEVGRALPAAVFPEKSLCAQGWGSCSGLSLGHLGLGLLQDPPTGPALHGWGRRRWDGPTHNLNLSL